MRQNQALKCFLILMNILPVGVASSHGYLIGSMLVCTRSCANLLYVMVGREEVSAQQLRDDLLSMLVAGHETTASALTWTLKLLAENPEKLAKVCPRP